MVEGLKHRDKMSYSLNLAKEVQQKLLPKNDPNIKGLDIAGKSIYCEGVGGDYYDYLYKGGHAADKICIAVGDVSDHGIQSALLMATVRSALRQRWAQAGNLDNIISDINHQLVLDVEESGYFMTMFLAEIDNKNKCVRWVNAGHDPAILYSQKTGVFDELEGHGIALGVTDDAVYKQLQRKINKGQIVVIGTDGIWESQNSKGDFFGKDKLKEIVKNNAGDPAKMILKKILNEVKQFCGSLGKEDDITITVIKIV